MNPIIRILIPAVIITIVTACNYQTAESPIGSVDIDAASDLLEKDANVIVLDVRTAEEYAAGHIDGALNIGIADPDFAEKVAKLDRSATYLVHCTANVENGRSAKSLKIMGGLGFNKLLGMQGGIAAWQQSGYPMVEN